MCVSKASYQSFPFCNFFSVFTKLICLLIILVAGVQFNEVKAIKCNATNTGVSNSGELNVEGVPCIGSVNLSISGTVCASGGCDLEYMFVIYQAGGSSYSTAWSTLPFATLSVPTSGSWNVIGCVREIGKGYPCETGITTISVANGPSGTPTNLQSTSACEGQNFSLSGTVSGGNTIKWYDNSNHLIGTGLAINHSETTSGTYTYKAYLNNGTCNSSTYTSINVSVGSIPSPVEISGPGTVVLNTDGTFSTPAISGASYSWTFTSPATGSSSTNSIDLAWATQGNKIVEVEVSLNGCVNTDQHPVVAYTDPCYPSSTNYAQYNLNYLLDGKTITDGAGTAISYNVEDLQSVLTSFNLNQNFSRSGDSSIFYQQSAGQNTTARIRANTGIANLKFCLRDLDYNIDGANSVKDKVVVNAFIGATLVNLNSSFFTLGSAVVDAGNTFYGNADVAGSSADGDLCFDFSGYVIDSFQLIFSNQLINGTISQDMGISNVEWCTTTPVPVTWLSFEGAITDHGVLLTWSTASELNNDHYIIQRSSNGQEFDQFGITPGVGTSQQINTYSYLDAELKSEAMYYRLKQVDFDGNYSYSKIIHLISNTSVVEFTATPNPVDSKLTVELNESAGSGTYLLKLTDMSGKVIWAQAVDKKSTNLKLDIITKDMPRGLYYLSIVGDNFNEIQPIVLQRD